MLFNIILLISYLLLNMSLKEIIYSIIEVDNELAKQIQKNNFTDIVKLFNYKAALISKLKKYIPVSGKAGALTLNDEDADNIKTLLAIEEKTVELIKNNMENLKKSLTKDKKMVTQLLSYLKTSVAPTGLSEDAKKNFDFKA